MIYVYGVIIRKLFLFEYIPDALDDDLDPIEFSVDGLMQGSRPTHLAAIREEQAGTETATFVEQFESYSRLLGLAFWQALESF